MQKKALKPEMVIHVVSDATGVGAERMARAALVQFQHSIEFRILRHAFVKSKPQLKRVLKQAAKDRGMVIYTMTDAELRAMLEASQYDLGLDALDMLGPILRRVGRRSKVRPVLDSGLLPGALGDRALRLAGAIDFTLEHDDGRGINNLGKADVILLGVSRTNKTPISMYLSCHHCLKVANVPLTPQVIPPEKIFKLKKPLMVGLTISPQKLAHFRRNRFKGGMVQNYYDLKTISQELDFSRRIFSKVQKIRLIDVTDRTIEEVAGLIA
ncbi:pyruvate, phosphate dikinase/phosphoenolpyruvate synthase regulator [Dethiosulfatarculus sandiegensis]|uniref:Phosphoenolpyruvate synthase regulatory protein n=1 Tax=Dethiosulfatarculus sandiegensis TaxID=1429043 RepID=A0A0D2JS99_9BACT|nr:pyruvate, phosphate dikinase/phosphoenolpyruvate synthase regulator [Dethiosulfatarculus sandiegensis]KIX12380.1 hypothetical protein X474_19460 [Dethiosulfatarculus sandiegensis]